jgi:hypothetical protein
MTLLILDKYQQMTIYCVRVIDPVATGLKQVLAKWTGTQDPVILCTI